VPPFTGLFHLGRRKTADARRAWTREDAGMICADAAGFCLQAWAGTPFVAAAACGLAAAILESPSARHRARPRAAGAVAALAAVLFTAAGGLAASALALFAALALGGALAASGGALWLAQAARDDAGGHGGDGPGPEGPRSPGSDDGVDWEAFEADFAAYAQRQHARALVRR
jgi:hypothetical protein